MTSPQTRVYRLGKSTLPRHAASLPRNQDAPGPGTMQVSDRGGRRLAVAIAQQRMTLDLDDVIPGFMLDVDALFQSLNLD
jgi:hypothetical protein